MKNWKSVLLAVLTMVFVSACAHKINLIDVSETGQHIDEEIIQIIFEPNHQAVIADDAEATSLSFPGVPEEFEIGMVIPKVQLTINNEKEIDYSVWMISGTEVVNVTPNDEGVSDLSISVFDVNLDTTVGSHDIYFVITDKDSEEICKTDHVQYVVNDVVRPNQVQNFQIVKPLVVAKVNYEEDPKLFKHITCLVQNGHLMFRTDAEYVRLKMKDGSASLQKVNDGVVIFNANRDDAKYVQAGYLKDIEEDNNSKNATMYIQASANAEMLSAAKEVNVPAPVQASTQESVVEGFYYEGGTPIGMEYHFEGDTLVVSTPARFVIVRMKDGRQYLEVAGDHQSVFTMKKEDILNIHAGFIDDDMVFHIRANADSDDVMKAPLFGPFGTVTVEKLMYETDPKNFIGIRELQSTTERVEFFTLASVARVHFTDGAVQNVRVIENRVMLDLDRQASFIQVGKMLDIKTMLVQGSVRVVGGPSTIFETDPQEYKTIFETNLDGRVLIVRTDAMFVKVLQLDGTEVSSRVTDGVARIPVKTTAGYVQAGEMRESGVFYVQASIGWRK